jgi:serine/threonine protein kinase
LVSLDKYIRSRGGLRDFATDSDESVEALKRKARLRRQSRHQGFSDDARPIHLLSEEEILSLFGDIVSGLAFLHDHNMLHLDIKAENILLHRLEGDEELL